MFKDQREAPRSLGQPQLTLARKWGPQSYNLKEQDSDNNLNELGSGYYLRFSVTTQPANTLVWALSETRAEKPAKEPRLLTFRTVR